MFIALLALWLVFGGASVTSLVLGLSVSALITLFASKFMGYSSARMLAGLRKTGRALGYGLFLIKEIVMANIAVIKLIYSGKEPEPLMVRFNAGLDSDAARVLLANSITLTPGTITVELEGDELWVHALDRSMAEGLEKSAFAAKAKELES